MKIKKLICLLLSIIISCVFFTGCDSSDDYVIYFELDSAPKTLDPQLANSTSEELLVKNLFEGLVRKNAEGKIVKGVAKDFSVSSDGRTYTFTLRENAKWSDDVIVKGKDFVFAFERAVDPKNKAPYVSSLYSIVGAKEISEGAQKDGLGVSAPNDNTVIITLNSPNPNFLETLTTAICMPCRKDIYNKAKGQYGIIADKIVTNGSYKIRSWEKSEKFSLRINKFTDYNGDFKSEAKAVIFNVGETKGRAVKIDEGNLDMGFIDISESSEKSNLFSYEKSNYALIINENSVFGTSNFKKAFAKSIHRNRFKNELGKSLIESSCLIPNTILLNGTPLSSQIAISSPPAYEPNEAYSLYIEASKDIKDLPSKIDILYYGNKDVEDLAMLVAESMQQALGAVVNAISTKDESSLINSISNGEYTLALIPLTAKSNSPSQFFESFTENSSNNIYGFKNSTFDGHVSNITDDADINTITTASESALKELINNTTIIPLAMHLEAFSYGKEFTCPIISPFGGVIDLALVTKIQ